MKTTIRTNADQVAARMAARARRLPSGAREHVRQVCRDALPAIEAETPVDTGKLRESWVCKNTRKGARIINGARYAGFVRRGHLRGLPANKYREALKKARFTLPKR